MIFRIIWGHDPDFFEIRSCPHIIPASNFDHIFKFWCYIYKSCRFFILRQAQDDRFPGLRMTGKLCLISYDWLLSIEEAALLRFRYGIVALQCRIDP
jgi:hypothetical protein